MFSLTDELAKFAETAYSVQLENAITLDDQFHGGGVTVHDLLKQNHFIISQMRKMREVLGNYCQLNDKIYKKVIEHELGVALQESKLRQMLSSSVNKTQQSLRTIAQLHSNTILQNQRAVSQLGRALNPLRQELQRKVGQSELQLLVKNIIEDYDCTSLGSVPKSDIEGGEGERKVQTHSKKRRGASSQDLNLFRVELNSTLLSMQQKINENKADLTMQGVKLHGNQAALVHIKRQVQYQREDLRSLSNKHQEQKDRISVFNDSLLKEIHNKTNENVWQAKLSQFNYSFVQNPLNSLKTDLSNLNTLIIDKLNRLTPKFDQIHQKISQVNKEIPPINKKIQSLQAQVSHNQQLTQQFKSDLSQNIQKITEKLQSYREELQKTVQVNREISHREFNELGTQLVNTSNQIQKKVLKSVYIKFGGQITGLNMKIRDSSLKLQNATGRVTVSEAKIEHLKDLVAKKANFTDLIVQSEKKAEKFEVKELKEQLNPESLIKMNSSMIFRSRDSIKQRKKSLLTSRNLLTPGSSNKLVTDDSGTKLFMCGFEDEIELRDIRQDKKQFSRSLHKKRNTQLRAGSSFTQDVI